MRRSETLLGVFARVLPREFRERVFEPAVADLLLAEHAQALGKPARWRARAGLIAACLRIGLPRLIWSRGRPTRFAWIFLLAAAVTALAIQRANYRHDRPPSSSAVPRTVGAFWGTFTREAVQTDAKRR